jgi:hypothetical protein
VAVPDVTVPNKLSELPLQTGLLLVGTIVILPLGVNLYIWLAAGEVEMVEV